VILACATPVFPLYLDGLFELCLKFFFEMYQSHVPEVFGNELADMLVVLLSQSNELFQKYHVKQDINQDMGQVLYARLKLQQQNAGISIIDGLKEILEMFTPAIAQMCFDISIRKIIKNATELVNMLHIFRVPKSNINMLYQILQTMDEDLLVLHPAQQKGFLLSVHGVTDNVQLQLLVANRIFSEKPTECLLEGTGPSDTLAKIMTGEFNDNKVNTWTCPYNFINWTIVSPGVTFPLSPGQGASHWIWNEGSPNEILDFEGQKILIIDTAFIPVTHYVFRVFEAVGASVKIEQYLNEKQTTMWISKLISQPEAKREEAKQKVAWISNCDHF